MSTPNLLTLLHHPEHFLDSATPALLKAALSNLYDVQKNRNPEIGKLKQLESGFNMESIYIQMEDFMVPLLTKLRTSTKELVKENGKKEIDIVQKLELNLPKEKEVQEQEEDEFEMDEEEDKEDLEEGDNDNEGEDNEEEDNEEDEELDLEDKETKKETAKFFSKRPIYTKTEEAINDKFFSIAKFHTLANELEETYDEQPNEEDDEDLAAAFDMAADENLDDETDLKANYNDFFDAPPTEEDEQKALEAEAMIEDEAPEEPEFDVEQSEFQRNKSKMADQISQLESEALANKHWTLKGEVSAEDRPKDAILETHLDYNVATKIAAPITEESTKELEGLIIQRIKDKSFDDVVRRIDLKPKVYKAPLELNSEKSKLGLADIYAQEFVSKATAVQDAETGISSKPTEINKDHVEIAELFAKLCYKLDALSNFHFTPKEPSLEIVVKPNVPALSMEEILPMSVADSSARAPHEVYSSNTAYKKKPTGDKEVDTNIKTGSHGVPIADSELTDAERKKIHKQKKAAQAERTAQEKANINVVERLNPMAPEDQITANKAKYDARHPTAIKNTKNVTIATNSDTTNYNRSNQVFTKLTDEQQMRAAKKLKTKN